MFGQFDKNVYLCIDFKNDFKHECKDTNKLLTTKNI